MSKNKYVWIPALLAAAIAIGIFVYSFAVPEVRPERNSTAELFKNLGTLAVFCGAVSFLWFRFKSRRNSRSPWIKRLSRWVYYVHQAAGYAAFAAVLAHGGYFLFYVKMKPDTFMGLSALIILLALIGYGLSIKRVRNVWIRIAHRTLSIVWIPFLLIHAGGSAILASVLSAAIWGLVWLMERHVERNVRQT